jgi:dTDP-L-rhamnose 4-epimerase
MEFKRVLISGGAGFIGSNLSLRLVNEGYEVTVLDNLSSQVHGNDPEKSELYRKIKDKVIFRLGDVSNRNDWEASLKDIDTVIHFAAETGTGQSMYSIENYVKTNIYGTALLWDILANGGKSVKKVIIASSRAVYGEGRYKCPVHGIVYPGSRDEADMINGDYNVKCPICHNTAEALPTTEDSKIHPSSVYGFTKQAQEDLSKIASRTLNIPTIVFRYQNVYGPGQSLSNPYTGILSIFSTRILNGNSIQIFEDGYESRDFVFVDDVVDATILGLKSKIIDYRCYNVGTGNKINVLQVAELLAENLRRKTDIKISGNFRAGDIRENFASLDLVSSELGFSPSVNFEDGINRFSKWVLNHDTMEDNYEKSINEMKAKGLFK